MVSAEGERQIFPRQTNKIRWVGMEGVKETSDQFASKLTDSEELSALQMEGKMREKAMAESTPFKDYYNRDLAKKLADRISVIYSDFDSANFVRRVAKGVKPLELKDRVALIREELNRHLPLAFPKVVDIFMQILPPPLEGFEGIFSYGYHLHPVSDYVATYGLEEPELSLKALHAITQCFTAEFAIRPFIEQHETLTLKHLEAWTQDPSEHVRRLVSEGSRSRLPWAPRLALPAERPEVTIALLKMLNRDPSDYVRRSVANHLNDLTRDHPKLVLETLTAWQKNSCAETDHIIRHALRSEIKAGNPKALALLGYGKPKVTLATFTITPTSIQIGDSLILEAEIQNSASRKQALLIDFAVHYQKANGRLKAKVFKGSTVEVAKGANYTFRKKVAFRQVTTRVLYPGKHRIELLINGESQAIQDLELESAKA